MKLTDIKPDKLYAWSTQQGGRRHKVEVIETGMHLDYYSFQGAYIRVLGGAARATD